MLGALARLLLEQPLRSREPAAGGPDRAAIREVHPDPDRRADPAPQVAALEPAVVGLLEDRVCLVVATEHESGERVGLEVLRRKRLVRIGS